MRWTKTMLAAFLGIPPAACSGDDGATSSASGATEGTESATGTGSTSTPTSTGGATDSGVTGTTATGTGSGSSTGATSTGTAGTTGGARPGTAAACFEDAYVNEPTLGPDYDQFEPVVGSHCFGTNHQDIDGIERVVFLGDSVTVGTPPQLSSMFYRTKVAEALAAKYGLDFGGQDFLWKIADPLNGTSGVQDAGDFSSCAKWGARNDDLLTGNAQIPPCFPEDKRSLRTLVVMTSGGNDISNLTQAAIDGASQAELWTQAEEIIQLKRDAIHWFVDDPQRFPNGVFVIFGNMFEFTDGTGDVESCDVSGLAGFDQPIPAPDELAEIVVWLNEQYGQIAVETGTDFLFMLEEFCGHGFSKDDPTAPCYRGPGQERWFDLTCIHPNEAGHQHLADMFLAVEAE